MLDYLTFLSKWWEARRYPIRDNTQVNQGQKEEGGEEDD